jgi:hypothetical protein
MYNSHTVISEDDESFSPQEGVETRWDLFEDRFGGAAVDRCLPLQIPFKSSLVKKWVEFDKDLSLVLLAMKQGEECVRPYRPYNVEELEHICRFMSPASSVWELLCYSTTITKDYLNTLGRHVRTSKLRMPYYKELSRSCGLYLNFGLWLDPIRNESDEDKREILAAIETLNLLTGIVHNTYLLHEVSRNGEVPIEKIDWQYIASQVVNPFILLHMDEGRMAEVPCLLEQLGTQAREISLVNTLAGRLVMRVPRHDRLPGKVPVILEECYTPSVRRWLYDRAAGAILTRLDWYSRLAWYLRLNPRVRCWQIDPKRRDSRSLYLSVIGQGEGDLHLQAIRWVGLSEMIGEWYPGYHGICYNDDEVIDHFSTVNTTYFRQWISPNYSNSSDFDGRLKLASCNIDSLIRSVKSTYGAGLLNILASALAIHIRCRRVAYGCDRDPVAHKLLQKLLHYMC